jgi:hypothetical protein
VRPDNEMELSNEASVAINASGYVFVGTFAAQGGGFVRIITPGGSLASIRGATGGPYSFVAGTDYDQGVFAMAFAADGDLLIGTLTQMYEWPASSSTISARNPDMELDGFDGLYGIAAHPDGRAFLADSGKGIIYVAKEDAVEEDWTKEVFVGRQQGAVPDGTPNIADGVGTAATFDKPAALAIDAARNVLYVADGAANLVRVVRLDTKLVTTLAGDPATAKAHSSVPGLNVGSLDGVGAAVRFRSPVGLTVSAAGNVFVTDMFNNGIRLVEPPDGTTFTVAGSTYPFHGKENGPGANARFFNPDGIATMPIAANSLAAGAMVIADSGNQARAWARGPPQTTHFLPPPPFTAPTPPHTPPCAVRVMTCADMPIPSAPPAPPAPPSSNTALAAPVATILLSTGFGLLALAAAVGAIVAWKTGALCFAPKGTGAPQAALRVPGSPNAAAWGEGAYVSPNPLASHSTV